MKLLRRWLHRILDLEPLIEDILRRQRLEEIPPSPPIEPPSPTFPSLNSKNAFVPPPDDTLGPFDYHLGAS